MNEETNNNNTIELIDIEATDTLEVSRAKINENFQLIKKAIEKLSEQIDSLQ